jgi:hypothetical protein
MLEEGEDKLRVQKMKAKLKIESHAEKEKNKERRGTQIDSDVNIGHGQDFYNTATTYTLKLNGVEIKPGGKTAGEDGGRNPFLRVEGVGYEDDSAFVKFEEKDGKTDVSITSNGTVNTNAPLKVSSGEIILGEAGTQKITIGTVPGATAGTTNDTVIITMDNPDGNGGLIVNGAVFAHGLRTENVVTNSNGLSIRTGVGDKSGSITIETGTGFTTRGDINLKAKNINITSTSASSTSVSFVSLINRVVVLEGKVAALESR